MSTFKTYYFWGSLQQHTSLAAFFISAGTIGNGKTNLTTDQYYIGTYNDLSKTKDFTFQYIDSLRTRQTKKGM